MDSPVDLLARAVADAAPNYLKVTARDLGRSTPCEGWDLKALLNHAYSRFVVSTNAARQIPTPDFDVVEIDYVGDDPSGVYHAMTSEMLDAWQACEDYTSERITPLGPVPPEGVLIFGAQDVFIHGWDVASALGVEPELSDQMIEVFTDTHRQTVDDQTRAMFFAPEVSVADDAPPLDRLVAFLGRQP